jgi:hypothetical protein
MTLVTAIGCVADPALDDEPIPTLDGKADSASTWRFGATLTKSSIRATNAYLSDSAFDAKWQASLTDEVSFMRGYAGAFHRDLQSLDQARSPIIGREGLCFGDAHPDNFGFLEVNGHTRFAYNDLDDSGYCPIALDAARYFAVLQLMFHDRNLTWDAIKQYAHTVQHASDAIAIDPTLEPGWDAVHTKGLDKLTGGQPAFLHGTADTLDLSAPSASERTAIEHLAATDKKLRFYQLLDIASVARDIGGSGSLRRYLLLVEQSGRRDVLELKQAVTPGTELGAHTHTLAITERLATLETAFWKAASTDDYFYVSLGAERFLVRNKFTKKSIDLADKHGAPIVDSIMAEVSYMALIHRASWSDITTDKQRKKLQDWLWIAQDNLSQRWHTTYKNNR